MAIDLDTIERLAPDQPALKAAAGLAKPGKWSNVAASDDGRLIWGECAGSGANTYRVMADLDDHGNKCTCPSRKFPCKHVLALFWLKAAAVVPFPAAAVPDWVGDWLGRRRKAGAAVSPAVREAAPAPAAPKDIATALAPEPEAVEDPRAAERRQAAAARRAEDTQRAILDALDALDSWIGDQLRLGLAGFLDDATARCRRIAARLVDGKAAGLAGRLDELPARLLGLPAGDRARGAIVELGKLVLLARAFRAAPTDAALRRQIATAEARESVLADPGSRQVTSCWEVLAEQIETRRDGLVSQTTWLLNLDPSGARFAMLLDYFPASAGRRGPVFTPGEQFAGEVVYYPGAVPLRALLVSRAEITDRRIAWQGNDASLVAALTGPLLAEPWASEVPILLPAGRIAFDPGGAPWWQGEEAALPLAAAPPPLVTATALTAAAALWSGGRLTLLAAQSTWGRIDGHG